MRQSKPTWSKIDRQLTSEPSATGAYTVQVVAHLTGWHLTRGNGSGGLTGAWVSLQPIMLLVRQGAEESAIPIVDSVRFTQNTLRNIAVAVSLFCGLTLFVVRRMSRNR